MRGRINWRGLVAFIGLVVGVIIGSFWIQDAFRAADVRSCQRINRNVDRLRAIIVSATQPRPNRSAEENQASLERRNEWLKGLMIEDCNGDGKVEVTPGEGANGDRGEAPPLAPAPPAPAPPPTQFVPVPGPAGPPGKPGRDGADGERGEKGEKGDKGDKGEPNDIPLLPLGVTDDGSSQTDTPP